MIPQLGVSSELPQVLGEPRTALAQLPPEPAERRGGVVAEIAAVLLDGAINPLGERVEPRLDRHRDRLQAGGALEFDESGPGGEPSPDRDGDRAKCGRVELASPPGERDRESYVLDTAELGLGRVIEQRDRLGRSLLPALDLMGVRRRGELEGAGRARLAGSKRREPLQDCRKLEELEGPRVHAGQFRSDRSAATPRCTP